MKYEKLKRIKELYKSLMQELDEVTEKEALALYEDATVDLSLCDFIYLFLNFQASFEGIDNDTNLELFFKLGKALVRAEQLHPVFAEGAAQGLGRVGEEYGELCQAINHSEPMERIEAEAMDLLVVAFRFARKDYEQPFNRDEIETGGHQ